MTLLENAIPNPSIGFDDIGYLDPTPSDVERLARGDQFRPDHDGKHNPHAKRQDEGRRPAPSQKAAKRTGIRNQPACSCLANNLGYDRRCEGLFIEIPPGDRQIGGVVGLKNCSFRHCRLYGLALMGPAEVIAEWKKEFSLQ
jgi:hypothetical protein